MKPIEVSVYQYTDYRKYLSDYFAEQKRQNRKFSFQFFSNLAGFKSKSFIHLVINGKKSLARSAVFSVSKALAHTAREAEYFENLVAFNQTRKIEEKNYYYEKLEKLTTPKRKAYLQKDEFDFFQNWYTAPLRELITIPGVQEDYPQLAKTLTPFVSPKHIKKAIQLLDRLGLIKKDGDQWKSTEKTLEVDEEVQGLAVSNFQIKSIELARESMDRFRPKYRDISTLTFGINARGYELLKEKLEAMRLEIAEFVSQFDNEKDRVYQLNLQLFPLTRIDSKEDDDDDTIDDEDFQDEMSELEDMDDTEDSMETEESEELVEAEA